MDLKNEESLRGFYVVVAGCNSLPEEEQKKMRGLLRGEMAGRADKIMV